MSAAIRYIHRRNLWSVLSESGTWRNCEISFYKRTRKLQIAHVGFFGNCSNICFWDSASATNRRVRSNKMTLRPQHQHLTNALPPLAAFRLARARSPVITSSSAGNAKDFGGIWAVSLILVHRYLISSTCVACEMCEAPAKIWMAPGDVVQNGSLAAHLGFSSLTILPRGLTKRHSFIMWKEAWPDDEPSRDIQVSLTNVPFPVSNLWVGHWWHSAQ